MGNTAPVQPAVVTQEEALYWIALRMVAGLGARRACQLLAQFRSPQAIFRASAAELEATGLAGTVARSIASGCAFEEAAIQQNKLIEHDSIVVGLSDPRYPRRLKEIYDPPVVLFARGRLELLGSIMLAVVGTRRPTAYGTVATEKLSGDLARAGLTITSGMARGIDTAAHRGALAAGGDTIAVFGCGLDIVYPAENRKLYAELCEKGLVLSEYPMGSPAYPQNFPVRNRIVSGMGAGVLVVEGAQYSGSSITARLALDQGREVFAVPGNITSRMSWGPNLLIKQGCKLVQEWNDVVVELPEEDRRELIARGRQQLLQDSATSRADAASLALGPSAELGREILRKLTVDKLIHIDELLENLEHYSSSEMIAALFELEMMGLVKQLPGRNFLKAW